MKRKTSFLFAFRSLIRTFALRNTDSMCTISREILCINDHVEDLSEVQTEGLIASLPEWRRETALRFKHLQGRRECAVGYIELLRGLRIRFGIEDQPCFAYNEHGKPYLPDYPGIHFSISHCKEAVGCLISDRPCGLDIERIRPTKEDLIRHTMSTEEAESIFAAPCPDIVFTRLWTQKEAVLKLLGTGIIDDLHHVLEPNRLQGIGLKTIENPYRGYVCSVAIHNLQLSI
jgi:4'-phosphopantetheinyl transferase